MAVFSGSFLSTELGKQTSVTVILPHDTKEAPYTGYPVLYFLHGKGDNGNTPLCRSNLEKYANDRGLCVVLPDIDLSFGVDMACGGKYFSFLTHELPELINNTLKVSLRREDCFIGGVSMGGYAALRCAFMKPELYGGVIALSPTADILMELNDDVQNGHTQAWKAILGEGMRLGREHDLYYILDDSVITTVSMIPKIYMACGRKDDMFNACLKLKDTLGSKRISFTFEQADADKEWSFWDVAMQRGFDCIIGKKSEPAPAPAPAAETPSYSSAPSYNDYSSAGSAYQQPYSAPTYNTPSSQPSYPYQSQSAQPVYPTPTSGSTYPNNGQSYSSPSAPSYPGSGQSYSAPSAPSYPGSGQSYPYNNNSYQPQYGTQSPYAAPAAQPTPTSAPTSQPYQSSWGDEEF